MTELTSKRITLDEILDELSKLARDEDAGADRFRALKMLAQTEVAKVGLGELLDDAAIVDRLVRLMKGLGSSMVQICYAQAFPRAMNAEISGGRYTYSEADHDLVDLSKKCTSLAMLYKDYPETQVVGSPKGFPVSGSVAMKKTWCQDQALKVLLERRRRDRQNAHDAMTTPRDGTHDAGDPQQVP